MVKWGDCMFFVSKKKYEQKCQELYLTKKELEKEKQQFNLLLEAIKLDMIGLKEKNQKPSLPITIELILKQEGR